MVSCMTHALCNAGRGRIGRLARWLLALAAAGSIVFVYTAISKEDRKLRGQLQWLRESQVSANAALASLEPIVVSAFHATAARPNVSACMNKILPHKRAGGIGELLRDEGALVLELPACDTLSEAKGWAIRVPKHLYQGRKR
jgi:hypothetical protein